MTKKLDQLQVIRSRMIAAGISESEADSLIVPVKEELERTVCGLVWEHTTSSIPDLNGKLPVLQAVPEKNIVQDPEHGLNHVLIEGENLLTLMAMQYTHIDENNKGLVDVIYIDPPYNTGNVTFAYNDKFEKSEWLSMMNVRLKLARNLLKDDGVLFMSLDSRFLAEAKLLFDDIFSSINQLGIISVVNNLKGRSDDKFFATANEFLLVYAKDQTQAHIGGFQMSESEAGTYSYHDEIGSYKPVGLKKTGKNCYREDRPNMFYPIYYNPDTDELSLRAHDGWIQILPYINGREGCWRWGKDKFIQYSKTELVCKKQKDEYVIYVKMRDTVNGETRTMKPKTVWIDPKYDSGHGTKFIKDMFGGKIFENPKPLEYIKDILRISTNQNSVILDFFAGSGTTGHAVLGLNKEDGGHRQFILCTNNELGKEAQKQAKTNHYEPGTDEYESLGVCRAVTYPRMQNVFPDYPGNNLYYYRISEGVQENDLEEVTVSRMAEQAVSYIALKENVMNVDPQPHDNYQKLSNGDTEILVVTDPDMDVLDIQDDIVPNAFTKPVRKVYCSAYARTVEDGVEYIPYPDAVLEALRAARKYVKREAE